MKNIPIPTRHEYQIKSFKKLTPSHIDVCVCAYACVCSYNYSIPTDSRFMFMHNIINLNFDFNNKITFNFPSTLKNEIRLFCFIDSNIA